MEEQAGFYPASEIEIKIVSWLLVVLEEAVRTQVDFTDLTEETPLDF